MTREVGIEIQSTRADPTMLIVFFESAGNSKVKRSAVASRGDPAIIQILLTIVGTWAAERYLLDPFADKFQEWIEALTSLEGKQFRISVKFQRGHLISIETLRFSNPLIIGNLWRIIKSASDLLANQADELSFDRILIVPGKQEEPFVIGYQGTRPTHILNLSSNTILRIKAHEDQLMEDIERFVSTIDSL